VSFDVKLLERVLQCPMTRTALVVDGSRLVNTDPAHHWAFALVDNIPNFLPDDAVALSHDEWTAVMRRTGRSPETGLPIV
jgi:uncharacterized protein YbaR (Trm112 family)